MLSSPGIGSGLDVNAIVSQMMALEQRPLVQMQVQQESLNVQISAFGKLKSDLSALQSAAQKLADADTFDVFEVASSDESVLTASVASGAVPANHTVTVTQLAQRHRLASASYADVDTSVGTGTLQISVGGNQFDLTIDSSNETLGGIRDAINAALDNTGVTASIINVTGGSRLILQSDDTGSANALEVVVTGDGDGNDTDNAGLSALVWQSAGTQNLSLMDAAQDASFSVDGFAATSSSNTVSGVIEGVTLQLLDADPGGLTSIVGVGRDAAAVTAVADDLVSAYNALLDSMAAMDKGELRGESVFVSIENQLRAAFASDATSLSGDLTLAFEAGFSFSSTGRLAFDSSTVSQMMSTDFSDLVAFFSDASAGFGKRLDDVLEVYTRADGVMDSRNDGLNRRIDQLTDQIANKQYRLTLVEERLYSQFTALDSLVATMQTTSSYLTQQLTALQGARRA